ncbi:ABC transporter ATP-binding protein [Candidatus Microgenomates bacterium]|nr:ABC transporter ATP-binding protein [Candidatus Microgenomates bacterium]
MSILKVFSVFYRFLLQNRRWYFVLFIFLVIVSNIAFSLNPYFYKSFVDNIPSLDFNFLLRLLYLFVGIKIVGVVFDILAFYIGDKLIFSASRDARLEIFKHVGELDYSFHTNKSTGSLISSFKRGDGAFFSFFQAIHHRAFSVVISFFVMLYFLIQLNATIVILVSSSLVVTILSTSFLVKNNINKKNIFNKIEDKLSGVITDNLINFETVKLFAKEKWENKRLKKGFEPWLKALWGYGNSFRAIDATLGIIINVSIFSILYVSIKQAVNLQLTIGEFVLVTGFLGSFYPKLWDLVWSTRDLAKNYADIQKYFSLLDYTQDVLEPDNPVKLNHPKGEIEFDKVNHSYKDGTKNAVRNFDLKINPGESVAFVGRSGSGKTTITKLLMRFFDPENGTISIDGINLKNFKKSDLRTFFGVVPQEPVLFNNTIAFNIGYGKEKATQVEIKRAAKLANISEFIEKLPFKYETNVGERGIKLSGGQKQRLAIARMILSEPDIIIFDEATSHLDSESEKLIQDAFWKVAKNKTTLIVAHRFSTIKNADRIVVMDKGSISEIGTHVDLLSKKSGIYKKLWGLQLEK